MKMAANEWMKLKQEDIDEMIAEAVGMNVESSVRVDVPEWLCLLNAVIVGSLRVNGQDM